MTIICLYEQVFKGKKMAGRMGGKQRTVKNVWVYKIDPARNLMWVRGQVRFPHKLYFAELSAQNWMEKEEVIHGPLQLPAH